MNEFLEISVQKREVFLWKIPQQSPVSEKRCLQKKYYRIMGWSIMVSSFRPRLWPGDLLALKNILRGFGDFFVLGGGGPYVGTCQNRFWRVGDWTLEDRIVYTCSFIFSIYCTEYFMYRIFWVWWFLDII